MSESRETIVELAEPTRELKRAIREVEAGFSALHQAGARRGATADEVAETLGVALLMDGGSASVNVARAGQAFIEFADQDTEAMRAVG